MKNNSSIRLNLAGMSHTTLPKSNIECDCGYNVDILNTNIEYNFGKNIQMFYLCPICDNCVHTVTYRKEDKLPHDKCKVILIKTGLNIVDVVKTLKTYTNDSFYSLVLATKRLDNAQIVSIPIKEDIDEETAIEISKEFTKLGAITRIIKK